MKKSIYINQRRKERGQNILIKMKAAIYCRVSTIDKGQTTKQQAQPLVKYCKEQGWEYEVFEDYASGSKESRPELDKMMAKIRSRELKAVLVLRLDRLGRSLKHLLQLTEEFRNKNVKFVCLNPNIDTTTPTGELMLQLLGAISQFERRLIQERIKDKLKYIDNEIEKKGYDVSKAGNKITGRGRPKESKDKKIRRTSGYYQRWMKK